MVFSPKEVLFSPTARCNLNCSHCNTKKSSETLPVKDAVKFLKQCKNIKINRIGFTGGEPFLAPDFLYALTKAAVKGEMLFDRIMTNGVWFKDKKNLDAVLSKLYAAAYDGDICVSVDKFHRQDMKKIALFIKTALSIWRRPDIVSIAAVIDNENDHATEDKFKRLCCLLNGQLFGFGKGQAYIKGPALFIKIFKIKLSAIGAAEKLKDPWSGKWFKEDRCKGPGNVFFVEPSGDVRPCCGYADAEDLVIGNIKDDPACLIFKNAAKNRFVSTVFRSGLSRIRKRLEKAGVGFPGQTDDHCYFCNYIIKQIPRRTLGPCLDR